MGHALGNNYGKFYSFLSKPVLLDLNFIVDSNNANGLGVRSVKGQGVKNVFMVTESTPAPGNPMVDPASDGFCLIELEYNYTRIYAGPLNIVSPSSGSPLAINASALTPGVPYIIASPGAGSPGEESITTVAASLLLAGAYFNLFDSYGNNFLLWFQVDGAGAPPLGVQGSPVPVSVASTDADTVVASKLSTVIGALPSGIAGVFSFLSSPTLAVIDVTSTANEPLAGLAQDGAGSRATGFTFTMLESSTNLQNWQSVGVPKGVVPLQGVSFIATAAGDGGHSSGTVLAVGVSGVDSAEIIGDPNMSLAPIPMGGSANVGGWLLLQFLLDGVVTAPADGSVMSLTLYLEQATRVGGNQE